MYIDSNVFITAAIEEGARGEKARHFLRDLDAEAPAITSALTIDEVAFVVKKKKGVEEAAETGEAMLALSGLRIVDATGAILQEALHVMRDHNINPRDAIHIATMYQRGLTTIVSDDADFDRVKSIKRVSFDGGKR